MKTSSKYFLVMGTTAIIYYGLYFTKATQSAESNNHQEYATVGLEVFKDINKYERRTCKHLNGLRIILTFASNEDYLELARNNCRISIKQKGVDTCYVANMDYIDKKFYKQNEHIFKVQIGAGKWIWKSYLILKFLDEYVEKNDILFYIDADFSLINPIDDVICLQHKKKEYISLFSQFQMERMWTKGDHFVLMNLNSKDIERMARTIQVYAGFVLIRKSISSLRFLAEWATYAQDGRLILDEGSGLNLKPDYSDFKKPRNDQSIVSLLSKRWRILVWPNPRSYWMKPRARTSNGTVFTAYEEMVINEMKPDWPLVKNDG